MIDFGAKRGAQDSARTSAPSIRSVAPAAVPLLAAFAASGCAAGDDGAAVSVVRDSAGAVIVEIGGDHMVVIERDELDVQHVGRYDVDTPAGA